MNKEQIIDEVYKNYFLIKSIEKGPFGISGLVLPKEEFINKCKTNTEFSEKWGLKIEERELSENERYKIFDERGYEFRMNNWSKEEQYDKANIPTKLITLEYNQEKIYIYE
jgi:hypothetical protein